MEAVLTQQPQEDQLIVQEKRNAWAQMGEVIYRKELSFQARAQEATAKLQTLPTTIDEVQEAEAILKEVKAACAKLMEDRKAVTSKFDDVAKRLMAPEKSFETPVAEYQKAIITVKQQYEQEQKKKQLKQDEYKRIREQLIAAMANYEAEYKTKIHNKVNAYYEWALNNITPDKLEDTLSQMAAKLTEADFTPPRPNPVRSYHTAEEIQALINECFVVKPEDYVAEYVIELEKRFSDFAIAFNNKAEAMRIANEEKERRQQEILQQQQNTVVAAQLDAFTTTDMSVAPSGVKALKKCYEVDIEAMGETVQTVLKIMAAFSANLSACLTKLKVNKWMSFTPQQAANCLGKLKSEDNAFQATGILFKEVEKL
jgi:hypothetical protein